MMQLPEPGLEPNKDQDDWDEWIASLPPEPHRRKLNGLDAVLQPAGRRLRHLDRGEPA